MSEAGGPHRPARRVELEAGVDEYCLSVARPDAATLDAITTGAGSCDKTLRALELLDRREGASR